MYRLTYLLMNILVYLWVYWFFTEDATLIIRLMVVFAPKTSQPAASDMNLLVKKATIRK